MTKIQKALFLGFFMMAIAFSAQVVTFTCQAVSNTVCLSGFRFRTQGSFQNVNLDSFYCVPLGSSCTPGSKKFNLQTCKVDYKNSACGTGVCFMYPQTPICTKDDLCGTSSNPLSYNANYKCDNCQATANCAKCFFKTTNETNATVNGTSSSEVTTQKCLGNTCTQGLTTVSASINRCANEFDTLGQKCECCVVTTQVARFCTSNSPALQQADVTTWFNRVEGNTQSEHKITMALALLLLTILGIMY